MTVAANGSLLVDALAAAEFWHRGQVKKGTSVPYVAHLLQVASLVLDDGGSEVEAAAALLHDALEDTVATEAELVGRFGRELARIVVACTDADEVPKKPWKPRKAAHVAHLEGADVSVARVAAADKLSNLLATVDDVEAGAVGLWDRFKGGMSGTVWYFEQMRRVLAGSLPVESMLIRRFDAALPRLQAERDRVRAGFGGVDERVAGALAEVPADPVDGGGVGWDPADAELVSLEVLRTGTDGPVARDGVWGVVCRWYDQPLPRDPGQRVAAIERLEADESRRTLRGLVDATMHAIG